MRLLLLALIMATTAAGGAFADVTNGRQAPNFTMVDTTGITRTLSDYKGKYVVLEWTNPDCPFVKKHYGAGNMQKLEKEYKGKGVVWLTIDSSAPGKQGNYPPDKLNAWAKNFGWAGDAFFADPEAKLARMYGAKTTPDMFIIDPKGKLIYQGAIDSIASPTISDIASATNYVQAALDAAMSGKPVAIGMTKSYGCSVKYKS